MKNQFPVAVVAGLASVLLLAGCSASPSIKAAASTPPASPAVTASPTATPVPTSYAELGAFGKWAKKFDEEYKLTPNFKDWNDVANQNCDLQTKGDTQGMVVPDTMANIPGDNVIDKRTHGYVHPISGRVWAAAVTSRCPQLLNTPPISTQAIEKKDALVWVKEQKV